MDQILKDLGIVSDFSDILRTKGINLQTFTKIVQSSGNTHLLREQIVKDCGFSRQQVLAICDRVKLMMKNDGFLSAPTPRFMSNQIYGGSLMAAPTGLSRGAPPSKRQSLLLKQPLSSIQSRLQLSTTAMKPIPAQPINQLILEKESGQYLDQNQMNSPSRAKTLFRDTTADQSADSLLNQAEDQIAPAQFIVATSVPHSIINGPMEQCIKEPIESIIAQSDIMPQIMSTIVVLPEIISSIIEHEIEQQIIEPEVVQEDKEIIEEENEQELSVVEENVDETMKLIEEPFELPHQDVEMHAEEETIAREAVGILALDDLTDSEQESLSLSSLSSRPRSQEQSEQEELSCSQQSLEVQIIAQEPIRPYEEVMILESNLLVEEQQVEQEIFAVTEADIPELVDVGVQYDIEHINTGMQTEKKQFKNKKLHVTPEKIDKAANGEKDSASPAPERTSLTFNITSSTFSPSREQQLKDTKSCISQTDIMHSQGNNVATSLSQLIGDSQITLTQTQAPPPRTIKSILKKQVNRVQFEESVIEKHEIKQQQQIQTKFMQQNMIAKKQLRDMNQKAQIISSQEESDDEYNYSSEEVMHSADREQWHGKNMPSYAPSNRNHRVTKDDHDLSQEEFYDTEEEEGDDEDDDTPKKSKCTKMVRNHWVSDMKSWWVDIKRRKQ